MMSNFQTGNKLSKNEHIMNIKINFSLSFFLLLNLSIFGAIPTGYYANLEGKKTAELKTAAFLAIKNHVSLKYDDLWIYFPKTDFLPSTPTEIWDMYSNDIVFFSAHSSIDK